MGAFCININGIEGLACSHEQAIAFGATKADIRADFWKKNLADANAIGRKDMHAIVAFTHPTCAGPDVPLGIAADTIRKACNFLAIEFKGHRGELSCGPKFFCHQGCRTSRYSWVLYHSAMPPYLRHKAFCNRGRNINRLA